MEDNRELLTEEAKEAKGKNAAVETAEGGERRAILVSVYSKRDEDEAMISLEELGRLLDTANGTLEGVVTQLRDKPDGRT